MGTPQNAQKVPELMQAECVWFEDSLKDVSLMCGILNDFDTLWYFLKPNLETKQNKILLDFWL